MQFFMVVLRFQVKYFRPRTYYTGITYHMYQSFVFVCSRQIGPRREKPCLRELANSKGADQPAHPRSLISAFVIRFLENFI